MPSTWEGQVWLFVIHLDHINRKCKKIPYGLHVKVTIEICISQPDLGDLIGNKITDKITAKPSKKSQNEEIQSDEANNEISKERYTSPKERQKIIDELKLT